MYEVGVRTISNEPTFNGIHNATRCKAWLVLYDRYLGRKKGLTLRELALISGIGYHSLAVSLSRWIEWRYIGYRTTPKGRIYRIRKRGKEWLERWWYTMPLQRYIEELENVQRGRIPVKNKGKGIDILSISPHNIIMNDEIKLPILRCLRCGYEWIPRQPKKPKQCARCNSPYWNKPKVKQSGPQRRVSP